MVDKRVYDYLLRYSRQYSLSDLKKYLISSGQDRNAVDEAAIAVIAQMGRAKAMERPNPIPKKLPMVGVQKKKPVAKKVVPVKTVKSKSVPKTDVKKQTKPIKQQAKDKNVESVKEKGKDLKTANGKDVTKKSGKKWIWILIIVLVVLAIAAGAVWYFFLR